MGNLPLKLGEARTTRLYGLAGGKWRSETYIKTENLAPVTRWRARTRIGAPTGTVELEASGATKAEARRRLQAAVEDSRARTPSINPDARLADYVAAWLARIDTERHLSAGTRRIYREAGERCVIPARGAWRLSALTPATITKYLTDEHDRRPGRIPAIRTVLKGALDLAIQEGAYAGTNPVAAAPRFPAARTDPTEFDREQFVEILALAGAYDTRLRTSGQMKAILAVLGATGVRPGEVLALRAEDWDTARRRLTISGTIKEQPTRRQPHTKTRAGWRTVELPDWGARVLDEAAAGVSSPSDLIFHTRASSTSPISPNDFRRSLREIVAGTPLAGFTPKALRRMVAGVLATGDLVSAAAQLGHANLVTLQAHYTAARPVSRNAAALTDLDPERALRAAAVTALRELAQYCSAKVFCEDMPAEWAFVADVHVRDERTTEPSKRRFEAGLKALEMQYPRLREATVKVAQTGFF